MDRDVNKVVNLNESLQNPICIRFIVNTHPFSCRLCDNSTQSFNILKRTLISCPVVSEFNGFSTDNIIVILFDLYRY